MKLVLDLPVSCPSSRDKGVLVDVIVDPVARVITHIVVQPRHRASQARLVPIADVVADETTEALKCTGDLDSYPLIESSRFVKMSEPIEPEGDWVVGIEHVSAHPYYDGDFGESERSYHPDLSEDAEVAVTFHRIPKGDVEIQRDSAVLSSDGKRIGRVDGFLVTGDHITHVVLEEGHLWGRHEVAIPVSRVRGVSNDKVQLSLAAADVEALPHPRSVKRP